MRFLTHRAIPLLAQTFRTIAANVTKVAEGMAAALLAAMFCVFIVQIFFRYVLVNPLGWTLEMCLSLWVWLVFFGNAFVVKHHDHVTFDVVYQSMGLTWRRRFALFGAAAIVLCMAISFVPTWDYIDFLKIKKSATLGVPMRTIFSVYALFVLAVIVRYATRFIIIYRQGLSAAGDKRGGG